MSIDLITVNGMTMEESGLLASECHLPFGHVCNTKSFNQPFEQMPIFIGEWPDGLKQNLITGHSVTETPAVDECSPDTCEIDVAFCTVEAPGMECIQKGTKNYKVKDIIKLFCQQNGYTPSQCGHFFDASGQFDPGAPLASEFADWLTAIPSHMIAETIVRDSFAGAFGIYSQVDNGWATPDGATPCPSVWNQGQALDWSALTVDGACELDAPTVGGTVNICGADQPVPAGYTFADLVTKLWLPSLRRNGIEITRLEFHVAPGEGHCLMENVACLQPCGASCGCHNDPGLRDRYETAYNSMNGTLWPTGQPFTILESEAIPSGTMRVVPARVRTMKRNGEMVEVPTYGLWMRDLSGPLGSLADDLDYDFGFQFDGPIIDLLKQGLSRLAAGRLFDSRTVVRSIAKEKHFCVSAALYAEYGVLALCRGCWLEVTGICCNAWNCAKCGDSAKEGKTEQEKAAIDAAVERASTKQTAAKAAKAAKTAKAAA